MKPKVFVSRAVPEEGLRLLRKQCEVFVSPHDRVLSKHELIEGVKGKDALLCLLTDKIDAEVMDANPNLRVVSNYAVGFNNVDVDAANLRQIPVCNTPGVLTEAVADYAFTLLLAVGRRVAEGDRFVRAGKYKGWAPMLLLGDDISNKTLGILGLGRIGKEVAKRAKPFNMKVIYHDVFRDESFEKSAGIEYKPFEEVLRKSDFITVHVPLLPQTHHLIGVKELNMMKRTAYLVNTSRGPVIDEDALVMALKHKVIAGAAIDVFEDEPKLRPGERSVENIILTPHIASATKETRGAMAKLAAENLLAVLKGKKPKCQVNEDAVKVGKGFVHAFHMSNGRILKNKAQLVEALATCSDHEFYHHVTEHKNDFATWLKDVLKDKALAGNLEKASSRKEALKALKKEKGLVVKKPVKKAAKKAKKKVSKAKSKVAKKKVVKKPVKKKVAKKKPKRKVVKKPVKKKVAKKKVVKKVAKKKPKAAKRKVAKKPVKKAKKAAKTRPKPAKKKASGTGRKRRKKGKK